MKTWKIATIVGLATIVVALLASSAFGYMGSYGPIGTYGGMMGRGGHIGGYGNGYYTNPQAPYQQGTATPYQTVYPFQFGGNCHRFGAGYGFGNGYGYNTPAYIPTGVPLNLTAASAIAQNYVASTGNPDLAAKEVEEYTNNFYVQVGELSTGNGAFELIIDKYTGSIYPEMGPNMMWNTKYGMMRGGILGGVFGTPTTTMAITTTQAIANAQQYLNSALAGTTTGDITTFYGYYTIEVLSNNSPAGMISVNGYTGQAWYHNWHGTYIQELEPN